jgi:hypothetical protein
MSTLKLSAAAAVTAALVLLTTAPAAVAGPWLAPFVLGHVIGAAARLATLPIIAASAASSAGQPPPPVTPAPYWAGYAAPPVRYASAAYYGPPAYYVPPPAYYTSPVGYYGRPQRYYPASAYRTVPPYGGAAPRAEAFPRYSVASMRYPDSYGRAVFSRSRGLANRRW